MLAVPDGWFGLSKQTASRAAIKTLGSSSRVVEARGASASRNDTRDSPGMLGIKDLHDHPKTSRYYRLKETHS